jgi:hypothetical protein
MRHLTKFVIGGIFLLSGCATTDVNTRATNHARTVISSRYQHLTTQRKRLAVLPFSTSTGSLDLTTTDVLAMEFMNIGFIVVDRTQLEAIFKELKLNLTGALSPSDVKQLGKVLSVDMLVAGTKRTNLPGSGLLDYIAGPAGLSIRMIDVETGEVQIASYCCDADVVRESQIPKEVVFSIADALIERSKEMRADSILTAK